jgi:DNA repair exonuclease SbcCD ATPase subunit
VYTIVLFEQSEKIFHQFPDTYLHYFEQCSNTGLKLELLQKYLFIPLDIFKKTHHNKTINNKLDAWLTFFSTDEPDEMIRLLEAYPEFRKMYEEVYELCRNMENVMETYSKELLELDRGTVQYMIDEMQDEIDKQKKELEQAAGELKQKDAKLEQQTDKIRQQESLIEQLTAELASLKSPSSN